MKREWYLFENIVMMVFCHYIACISLKGTIYKFVFIRVCRYKAKVIKNLNHLGVGQVKNGSNDIVGNLLSHFFCKYFFVLGKNFVQNTKGIFPINEISPNRIVGATSRKRHQQTVGVKNNVHYCLYGVRMCSVFHPSITSSLRTPLSQRRSMASSARLAKYWPSIR